MAEILLIEDNPENLQLMVYLLTAFGHTCREALTGEAGLQAVSERAPDLVLCDIQLPRGMDGYEVCRALKSKVGTRAIPIIAVTAMAMVGDRDRVLAAGFDGYVAKPIDPQHFVAQVEVYVAPAEQPGRNVAEPVPAERVEALRSRTILVVDNAQVNLELMRSIFEPHGFRIVTASNAHEGLELAQREPPDLIISDVHMPGQSGFDFIQQIKGDPVLRSLPFVFISSTVFQDRDRHMGLSLGADRFIERPIGPQELLVELETVLKEHSQSGNGRAGEVV